MKPSTGDSSISNGITSTVSARLSIDIELRARGIEVALEVQPGETIALMGPNGAGKSSVLAAVAGLLRPESGRILLDDQLMTGEGSWTPAHARGVALLAQDAFLFPHMSVLDNVAFGPRSQGIGRRPARERAMSWLDKVGVADYAIRRPSQLSGGQQQRVAIARALAAEPRLLLLDEPMAALDVTAIPAVRRVLAEVLRYRTAVMVTHDVIDAMTLADRVAVFDNGRLVELGSTTSVFTAPRSAFAAELAGLNLVRGRWRAGKVTRDSLSVAGQTEDGIPADGEEVIAVWDPAAVAILRTAPDGSPRNVFQAVVRDLEPRGQLVRVRTDSMAADITIDAAVQLGLQPGSGVFLAVKAAEVRVLRR